MMYKNNYQSGDKIGVLTFLNRVPAHPDRPTANFRCDCGKEFISRIDVVKSLKTKSCGCRKSEFIIKAQTKHAEPKYIYNGKTKVSLLPQTIDINNFWSKVAITANPNRCWNWTGTGQRYGSVRAGKKMYRSNRVAYFIHTGIDPKELSVIHSCDNPKCCNPKHLSLGTHTDNMRNMFAKGRGNPAGKKSKQHYSQQIEIQ